MDIKTAIEILETGINMFPGGMEEEAFEMAILSLAKQIPSCKVEYDNAYTGRSFWTCGDCGETVAKKDIFCRHCGQRLEPELDKPDEK